MLSGMSRSIPTNFDYGLLSSHEQDIGLTSNSFNSSLSFKFCFLYDAKINILMKLRMLCNKLYENRVRGPININILR